MNVIFRVDCNTTIGTGNFHRCLAIANKLSKKYNIFFVMNESSSLITKHKKNFKFIFLEQKTINQRDDANKLLKQFLNIKINFIFLDQYKLGSIWKSIIVKKCKNLTSFNDLLTEDKISKYQICCNLRATPMSGYRKLFGPQYFITNKTRKIALKKSFDILFYNGGSGDFIIFKKIVRILLNYNFKIRFIIGPLCKNFDWIIALSKKNKLLSYSINTKKIIYEFSKARLVVASAGTSTYELNISRTPSILFKASIDQLNNKSDLEKLGHYFLFSQKDINSHKKFSSFLKTLIESKLNNLKSLINKREVDIDLKGSKRIIDRIFYNKKLKTQNKNTKKNYFKISKIRFSQINQVYELVNKNNNRKISIRKKKISYLDHCVWWLLNKRDTYSYTVNGKIKLIFYHQVININKKKYIIAGWYAEQNLSFLEILKCLSYQFKIIPSNYRWLSIIHKRNRISKKINQYFNFKRIENNSTDYYSIKKIYKNIDNFDCYYLDK